MAAKGKYVSRIALNGRAMPHGSWESSSHGAKVHTLLSREMPDLDACPIVGDIPCAYDPTPAIRCLAARALRTLDARKRRILHMYFLQGIQFKDIAEPLGVTPVRVRQLLYKGLARISHKWGVTRDDFFEALNGRR